MPRDSHSIVIGASCEDVFDLVHDYRRRLEWDTMLREACLLGGAEAAGPGVRTRCVGTWKGAFQVLETEYVRFERGKIATVKLTNRPLLFRRFAATIRHDVIGSRSSRLTYTFSFQASPVLLASMLEPLMKNRMAREVRDRLGALRDFMERTCRK